MQILALKADHGTGISAEIQHLVQLLEGFGVGEKKTSAWTDPLDKRKIWGIFEDFKIPKNKGRG